MVSNEPRKTSEQNCGFDNRMARTARRSLGKLVIVTALGSVILACSGSNQGSTGAIGGGSSTEVGGGAGTKGTAGSGAQVGGTSSTGGSSAAGAQGGNTAQAGASTGGTTTVSSSTGGASTGGTPANTGGAATGGAATGGNSATTGTGGSATGGAATGGAATGGTSSVGTGGAATGGAATGGTSSCAAATITMISSADYQLKSCNITLDVNPQIGARITTLTITNGTTATNVIYPYACTGAYDPNATCNSSGSTFWTSPQSGWDGTVGGGNVWPPLAAIDGNAYTPSTSSNVLTLTGSADATLGASVTKAISADSTTGWITLAFTIKTQGKAISAAPWQITRVERGGIVLFPLMSLVSNTTSPQWVLSPSGGYEWIDDTNQTSVVSTSGAKIIADGGVTGQSYTWLAYAEPPPSGQTQWNLFLIKYPDVAQSAFAPGESDTEVYPGSGYIELEAQGAYSTIAANSSSSPWTVQWRVAPIPSSVTVAAGSATLATFAQQQAAM